MTSASAFHFASLVWDWPIAIYLFLIGISAGLVTLAILLRRFHPRRAVRQYAAAHYAGVRAGGDYSWSADSGLSPDAPVDLLEADVPLQLYLGDVDGGDAVPVVHGSAGAVAGENL